MLSKKGLSDIVTSVLIILLVLVAIGIIWAFLRPAINQGAGQLEGITEVYGVTLTIEPNSATINSGAQTVSVTVRRNEVAAPLAGMNIILEDASGTTRISRNETIMGPLESRQIIAHYASLGFQGAPVRVSVVPLIGLSGSQERIGTPSDKVSISVTCQNGATQACTATGGYAGTQTCTNNAWGACTTTQSCGDGTINGPEQCDSGIGTATCQSRGFAGGGILSCYAAGPTNQCTFDTSQCMSCSVGQQQSCTYIVGSNPAIPGATQACAQGAWGTCSCYADLYPDGQLDSNDESVFLASPSDCNNNGDISMDPLDVANDYQCFRDIVSANYCTWSACRAGGAC